VSGVTCLRMLYLKYSQSTSLCGRDNSGDILKSAMSASTQVWIVFKDIEPKGLLLTGFSYTITGGLDLYIYALASFNTKEPFEDADWQDGYETLSKFAKLSGCARIVAVTDSQALAHRAAACGGHSRFILYVPVKEM
jgi:hypothetical protein